MTRLVLLDSGPLGLVTNPRESEESRGCKDWLRRLLERGDRVMIPAIADYEVRRELLRAGKLKGLRRLDDLIDRLGYLPVERSVLDLAAALWAESRREGKPTAPDSAIDADVILAAQARLAAGVDIEVVIATTNVGHLGRFTDARSWAAI